MPASLLSRPIHRRLAAGCVVAALAAATVVGAAFAGPPGPPTVVELFQSQGCSSCPPANANILTLADRPDLLVLSFGVTYWDRLGWKDTFASRENTQRQYDYAKGLKRANVATPQVVINGHVDIVGNQLDALKRAIAGTRLSSSGPAISLGEGKVTIGAVEAAHTAADVWLVRYDPRTVQVPIKAGENGGRTLPHRNVVRELVRLGGWSGKAESYVLPPAGDPAYRTAILVQAPTGGRILTAYKS